ncbi:hypothetical protein A1O3_00063 [Capronia epimyces CBS 606.96]|uniref:DUF7066 domain-containing protein n=1 Tax=Capronia epimyces CBS 606.96 TaxID=1182542 RepID=W9YPC4_9EURO|nr:uncharacterized protein A1O3_00063 [Capronia epimyces CBS 606.96]EXJ91515.1 hypothetical protein A1O3_00063 [Capronia epimyces CBS 606.96]
MAINWRLRDTVFRLLAAVYAELGEEAFKGRYVSIAQYFGPDATYDAIKSFFSKEVSRAAEQLMAKEPHHRGSGRRAPQRRDGRQARPPFLYFDDEDISILTEREAEAHFNHSLRAPAKRPRVVATSPVPSAVQDGLLHAVVPERTPVNALPNGGGNEDRVASPHEASAGPSSCPCPSSNPGPSSYFTPNEQEDHTAQEKETGSKKRPFSALNDTAEKLQHLSVRPSDHSTPIPDSFGYVTNQGQFRCALCLSQLPSQEDLDRHELLSREHRRNLQNSLKLSKGREKLAQVTSVSRIGPHLSTPVPPQPPRLCGEDRGVVISANGGPSQGIIQENGGEPSRPIHPEQSPNHCDTLCDTIEVFSQPTTLVCQPEPTQARTATPAFQPETLDQRVDKGKGRAASLSSSFSDQTPQQYSQPGPCPPSEEARADSLHTRPTTARTEIGSITPSNSMTGQNPGSNAGTAPLFSATEISEIMRSTEVMIRLMSYVQKEAVAVVKADAGAGGSESSAEARRMSDGAPRSPLQSLEPGPVAPEANHTDGAVETNIKRRRQQGRVKAERAKDTGEEVFFIVLD